MAYPYAMDDSGSYYKLSFLLPTSILPPNLPSVVLDTASMGESRHKTDIFYPPLLLDFVARCTVVYIGWSLLAARNSDATTPTHVVSAVNIP